MALVLNDRVKETSTTTGTGTFSLSGAVSGFESFVTGIADGNTTYYAAVNRSADEWEVGIGTISDASPDTLARTTIISSSNSDSAVDFSAGTKDIFVTLPASKVVFEDASSDVTLPNDLILGSDSAVLKFGADSDTTLTHTDGTGLTLNSTNKLLFRDTGLYINSSTDGQLDIVADTEIQIAATTIDINGAIALNGAITGATNVTLSGELDAGSLDVSGDADIDGTLEADAITIDGVTLAETIADTVGAMVTSNTESGITVAYVDGDNTLDFTVGTLNQNTTGSAATLTTARTIGGTSFDGSANIAVALAATATALASARTIGGTSFDGTGNIAVALASVGTAVTVADESSDTTCFPLFATAATGDLPPKSGSNLTFNSSSGLLTATLLAGNLTGDVTGNADTATLATLATTITATANNTTAETVYLAFLDGATGTQGIETDTGLTWNPNTNVLTAANVAGTVSTATQNSITTATGLVTTGALDTGSITSGFGTIDTGASTITTTGLISGGSLDIDNVLINGTTIGHTDDTDLITVADGLVTVAGEVQMTTLDIGGTNVSATAAEINYSDLATLGTSAASKVLTADANNLTKISGGVYLVEDTLSFDATQDWDVRASPVAKVTLTANVTFDAPTNPTTGQYIAILCIQDAGGTNTIAWNAVFEFTGDVAPTATLTGARGDLFTFRYNGAKWLEVGRNLNLVLS